MTISSVDGRCARERVAIVTGASRGLGSAFAKALSNVGFALALVARIGDGLEATAEWIRHHGGHARTYVADVSDPQSVELTFERIANEVGAADLLVNNAGIMAPIGRDWDVDPKAWWRTFEVNVLGSYLCTRAVLPQMLVRRAGRIINISSTAAYNRYPYYSAYGASKAALVHFTGSLADAVHEFGVRVFALSPGFVRTDMTEALADAPELQRFIGDRFRRALDEGRHTPVATAVDALLFLASGYADALSGAHVDARADLGQLVRTAMEQQVKHG